MCMIRAGCVFTPNDSGQTIPDRPRESDADELTWASHCYVHE